MGKISLFLAILILLNLHGLSALSVEGHLRAYNQHLQQECTTTINPALLQQGVLVHLPREEQKTSYKVVEVSRGIRGNITATLHPESGEDVTLNFTKKSQVTIPASQQIRYEILPHKRDLEDEEEQQEKQQLKLISSTKQITFVPIADDKAEEITQELSELPRSELSQKWAVVEVTCDGLVVVAIEDRY